MSTKIQIEIETSHHSSLDMERYVKDQLNQAKFVQETNDGFNKAYELLNRACMMQQVMDIGICRIEPDDGIVDQATIAYLDHYCDGGCAILVREHSVRYVIFD